MKRPISVTVNFVFILLNVLIWLILGIIIAADVHPALPDLPAVKSTLAALSIALAGILLFLLVMLYLHKRVAFFLTLVFFACTVVLTFFDEVGISDIIVLSINIIPIILLIKDRAWYLEEKRPEASTG
ncbi:MAG: hypothetical protein ACM3H7_06165 [Acidobacteriaceae bacterium]